MAQIVVDPQKLRDTASRITMYVEAQKRGMREIGIAFAGLRYAEVGGEFDVLQTKWAQANGDGSTSQEMLSKLERYANYLNSCARNYETARENARIRSSWI